MIFRSPRLTALFGAPAETVTYEQLAALVGNDAAAEAEDLDYKLKLDGGDEGNESLAIDIATFANHRGGVIVVGMADADARPAKAIGIDLSDGLKRRILSVAAERIFPTPQFDLREVPDPAHEGKTRRGLLLIIIPASANAPHAVINPNSKDKLAYPRRHGSKKIWLTEGDVAAAYRRRFAAATDQRARLSAISDEVAAGIRRLRDPNPPTPLLVVSLVPDVPGDLLLDREAYRAFQQHALQQQVLVGSTGEPELSNTSVGPRRLIGQGGRPGYASRTELHTDGAATLAVNLTSAAPGPQLQVWDSQIAIWIASALRYLARHARDRTGASGLAAVSAVLAADVAFHPAYRLASPSHLVHNARLVILTASAFGTGSRIYGAEAQRCATGEGDFLLDDLADGGQGLAAATAQLTSDVFLAFNAVDTEQISRDGVLQQPAWGSEWDLVRRWAAEADIPTNPPAGAEQP
ncbi:AlbA family DNA-binding domain-containing protein [Planomonospora parontospora]|uniref:AlbA family DNA-binding domain-containing protein n=1 Tax=Planomonospora parontospora TaxID=58119 RepID=UPI00167171B1|nr:ATP-binding protein [Planomonospora parontospora]GGL55219.1 hypothetical protein GCM10014719_65620 [Planomonospora parontospora subsp. antibiotica]GII19788.1 hypothetical protein Ppa05_65140 [Planomonospora parontospora subsp. antibiotica]